MDVKEFNTSVYPLKDKIFRFAKRMLEHSQEAEDLVQEVFLKMWRYRESLDRYRSLEALAMVTTRNLCLDRIKARKLPFESLSDQRMFIENLAADEKPDYSDLLFGVKAAMNELPEQSRMVIHLRDVEGYEFDEIAEILGMQENAVRVALSRARKRIREKLINEKKYEYRNN
jgi:RNA polymerase sigma-70 factor (ECF subfamily)